VSTKVLTSTILTKLTAAKLPSVADQRQAFPNIFPKHNKAVILSTPSSFLQTNCSHFTLKSTWKKTIANKLKIWQSHNITLVRSPLAKASEETRWVYLAATEPTTVHTPSC